jgi:hypothetical protein
MVNPTWVERDLPVLRAFVELWEESGGEAVGAQQIEGRTGFDETTVQASLLALLAEEPALIRDYDGGAEPGSYVLVVDQPTGEARRRLGLWPTPELLADRLVAALAQAAEREPNEERRGLLKRTAEWLGSAGRDVAVDVAAAVISRQVGGA